MTSILLPAEPLTDGVTALRPWRDSDLSAIVAACQDPEIGRWTNVPSPYLDTDARAYLSQRYDALHAGRSAPFGIVDSEDGRLLGSVALTRLDWGHARGEVGYWLAREARGSGHATRAVRLLCAWGFGALGLQRCELFVALGHTASQGVAERAGFTREALLRSYIRHRQTRHDAIAYGLLIGEGSAAVTCR